MLAGCNIRPLLTGYRPSPACAWTAAATLLTTDLAVATNNISYSIAVGTGASGAPTVSGRYPGNTATIQSSVTVCASTVFIIDQVLPAVRYCCCCCWAVVLLRLDRGMLGCAFSELCTGRGLAAAASTHGHLTACLPPAAAAAAGPAAWRTE